MDKLINILSSAFVGLIFLGIVLLPLWSDYINGLGDTKDGRTDETRE